MVNCGCTALKNPVGKKATSLRWKRVLEQLRYTIARSPLLNIPFVSSMFRIKAVCYKRPLRSQLVKTPWIQCCYRFCNAKVSSFRSYGVSLFNFDSRLRFLASGCLESLWISEVGLTKLCESALLSQLLDFVVDSMLRWTFGWDGCRRWTWVVCNYLTQPYFSLMSQIYFMAGGHKFNTQSQPRSTFNGDSVPSFLFSFFTAPSFRWRFQPLFCFSSLSNDGGWHAFEHGWLWR